jgi:hypothetical protein
MSALGQKQTFAPQKVMSALPPRADISHSLARSAKGPKRTLALPFFGVISKKNPASYFKLLN